MFEEFIEWAKKGSRKVEISFDHLSGHKQTQIWVFDADLMVSKYVDSIEEVNLNDEKEKGEKAEYERLKAKYE